MTQEGADPTLKSASGRIPLHEACIGGHTDVVCILLDHMSNMEIADRNKQTAAHHAAYNGEGKCLKMLAAKGEHYRSAASLHSLHLKMECSCLMAGGN